MKELKRILSLALTLCMLLGMMVFPARAESGPTLSLDSRVGIAGKDLYLNLTLSGNETVGMKAMNAVILYNKNTLTCSYFDETADADDEASAWVTFQEYCNAQKYNKKSNPDGIYSAFSQSVTSNYETAGLPEGYDASIYGVVKLGYLFDTTFAEGKTGVGGFAANGVIGQLGFDVSDEAELGDNDLILLVTTYTDGSGRVITGDVNTVNGKITVVNSGVFLEETEVTIDGTNEPALPLTAIDTNGSSVAATTQWTVTAPSGEPTWKGSVRVENGVVKVKWNATAGDYTIEAASGSFLDDARSVTLTVRRNPSVIASVEASAASELVVIPIPTAAEGSVSVRQEALVYDQYGELIPDEGGVWSLCKAVTGVTVTSGGLLTVTNEADDGVVSLRVAAANKPEVSCTYDVTLTKEPAVATAMTLVGGAEELAVPYAAAGASSQSSAAPFIAVVYDQYGKVMPDEAIEWSASSDEVSIDNGVVSVTNASFMGEGSAKQAQRHAVTVTAACGSLSESATLYVTREALEAASVAVSGDAALTVPVKASDGFEKQYTAAVCDQYGFPLEDTVAWSTDYYGTSIGTSGLLTVTNRAVKGTAHVTATASNGLFDTLAVELDKSPMIVRGARVVGRTGNSVAVDLSIEDNTEFSSLTVYAYYKTDKMVCSDVSAEKASDGKDTVWKQYGGRGAMFEGNPMADVGDGYDPAEWGCVKLSYVSGPEDVMTVASGVIGSMSFDIDETAMDGVEADSLLRDIRIVVVKATNAGGQEIYTQSEDGSVEIRQFTPGDVDEDDLITANDALWALMMSVDKTLPGSTGWTNVQRLAADVDGIEGVSANDALWILEASVDKRILN